MNDNPHLIWANKNFCFCQLFICSYLVICLLLKFRLILESLIWVLESLKKFKIKEILIYSNFSTFIHIFPIHSHFSTLIKIYAHCFTFVFIFYFISFYLFHFLSFIFILFFDSFPPTGSDFSRREDPKTACKCEPFDQSQLLM